MSEKNNFLDVYEKFLGLKKQGIPRKRRCHQCYRPYFVVVNKKGLCRKCEGYGQSLFLENLHKETLI